MNDMFKLKSLIKEDNKIIVFVGTSKNGTSFIVNHLAQIYANSGINTAILDMTRNKNSFYIYTHNNDTMRNITENTMKNLDKGIAEGIKVKNNLTVYTSVPEYPIDTVEPENILTTLVKNHSLILIDCDFETDPSYFLGSQEICLVQSMDVLTIQPLTKFLYQLTKSKCLDTNKIRVIINKKTKLNALEDKYIVSGLANYNDPMMRYIEPIFDASRVKVNTISLNEKVYIKYLNGLIDFNISISGYPSKIVREFEELAKSIYKQHSKKSFISPINIFKSSNKLIDE